MKHLGLASLLLLSTVTSAAVLFENPGSDSTQLSGSCTPCSGPAGVTQMFDSFWLGQRAMLESASFSVARTEPGFLTDLQVSVWDQDLSHALFVQTIKLVQPLPRYFTGTLKLDLSPFLLEAGTHYISIFGLNSADLIWHFTDQPLDGSVRAYNHTKRVWSDFDTDAVMTLYGTTLPVPEPAPALALMAGLGLIALLRRGRIGLNRRP